MTALPRIWTAAACALTALLCTWLTQTQAADTAAAQPKIQFFELSHDFGKSGPNMDLKHTFAFKNVGKAVLIIQEVKAG